MSSRPPIDGSTSRPRPIEVAIVGNDALVAALPARPVQLSHAILAMGYDFVIPVSWGEELLAEHALRALSVRGTAPAIFCACTRLRERLLAAGSELAEHLITFVPPAVAAARYVRTLHPSARMRVTFIGGCDTGGDAAINATFAPTEFLHRLAERGISAVRQPAVFDSIIPPDRRRHYSLPGGCPSSNALALRAPEWRQVTIDDDAFAASLAELLIAGEHVVIDLTPRLGCSCCSALGGIVQGEPGERTRGRLAELEPPRSPAPILEHDIEIPVHAPPVRRGRARASETQAREATANIGASGDAGLRELMLREQEQRDDLAREHAAREQAAREQAAREQAAREQAAQAERERVTLTQASLEQAIRELAARELAARELRAAQAVAEHAIAEHDRASQEGDTRETTTREPEVREKIAIEREVARTVLSADVGASLRSPAHAPHIEVLHAPAARRRIAITPASVPIFSPRSVPASASPLTALIESRTLVHREGEAPHRQALASPPAAALVERQRSSDVLPVRERSVADDRAPTADAESMSPTSPRSATEQADSTTGDGHGSERRTDVVSGRIAAGEEERRRRGRSIRVHETFVMARMAAHTRAVRASKARERRRPILPTSSPPDESRTADASMVAAPVLAALPELRGTDVPEVALEVARAADAERLSTTNAVNDAAFVPEAPNVGEPESAGVLASDPATIIDAVEPLAHTKVVADESPTLGARLTPLRGPVVHSPAQRPSERLGREYKKSPSFEPHPLVTLAISIVAIVAVLVALAVVLQRNPLAP